MTVQEKYKKITSTLIQDHLKISTMESCTAGFIASLITDTEGASAIFEGSYITYANRTKIQCGVPSAVLEEHGVYSKETAAAMAKCCLQGFSADLGIGVTGSFGNVDPSNPDSVPGEVYYAIATKKEIKTGYARLDPLPSRFAYKMDMAERIADELLTILTDLSPDQISSPASD